MADRTIEPYRIEEVFSLGIDQSSSSEEPSARIEVVQDFPTMGGERWRVRVMEENADPEIAAWAESVDERGFELEDNAFAGRLNIIFVLLRLAETYSKQEKLPLVVRVNMARKECYQSKEMFLVLRSIFKTASLARMANLVTA